VSDDGFGEILGKKDETIIVSDDGFGEIVY